MRAIRFEQFGDPSRLAVAELPDPTPAAGMAVVRVEAAGVNPSDVKNVAGAMAQTSLPRVPGRDYAGVVEQGPAEWLGAAVWGSGGDLGFTRDGTHAERLLVPAAGLSRKPERLSFVEAASVGVTFVTAWCAVVEAAALQAGETLLVIGASGGVGGAAVQIGRQAGARVVGADRSAPRGDAPAPDVHLAGAADLPAAVRGATGGRGADVVLDCVGGRAMFATAVRCLAPRGRLVEISATGGRMVEFDLADFYHDEGRLLGVDSLKRDAVRCARLLDAMRPRFEDGLFRPAPVAARHGLAEAAAAFRHVAAGAPGRVVLLPQR